MKGNANKAVVLEFDDEKELLVRENALFPIVNLHRLLLYIGGFDIR